MKKLIALAITAMIATTSIAADTKTVCKEVKRKDGQVMRDKAVKPVQECKKIKVHKKVDGTRVPEKSPKK